MKLSTNVYDIKWELGVNGPCFICRKDENCEGRWKRLVQGWMVYFLVFYCCTLAGRCATMYFSTACYCSSQPQPDTTGTPRTCTLPANGYTTGAPMPTRTWTALLELLPCRRFLPMSLRRLRKSHPCSNWLAKHAAAELASGVRGTVGRVNCGSRRTWTIPACAGEDRGIVGC